MTKFDPTYVVLCIPHNGTENLSIDSTEEELAFGPFSSYLAASDELEEMRNHDCQNGHIITKLAGPYT